MSLGLSKKELVLLMLELNVVNSLLTKPVDAAIEQATDNRKHIKPLTSLYEKLNFEASDFKNKNAMEILQEEGD